MQARDDRLGSRTDPRPGSWQDRRDERPALQSGSQGRLQPPRPSGPRPNKGVRSQVTKPLAKLVEAFVDLLDEGIMPNQCHLGAAITNRPVLFSRHGRYQREEIRAALLSSA